MEVEQGPEEMGKDVELMLLKHFQTLLNGIDKDKRIHVTPLQALYVINRAMAAEEQLAALREENEYLKAQTQHEADKAKPGCECWRRRCLDAEVQVAWYQKETSQLEQLIDALMDYDTFMVDHVHAQSQSELDEILAERNKIINLVSSFIEKGVD